MNILFHAAGSCYVSTNIVQGFNCHINLQSSRKKVSVKDCPIQVSQWDSRSDGLKFADLPTVGSTIPYAGNTAQYKNQKIKLNTSK